MGVIQAPIKMLARTNVLIVQAGIFQLGKTQKFVSGVQRVIIPYLLRILRVHHVEEVNLETEKRPRQKHWVAVTALVARITTKNMLNRITIAKGVQKGDGMINLAQQNYPIVPHALPGNMVKLKLAQTTKHLVNSAQPVTMAVVLVSLVLKVALPVQKVMLRMSLVKHFVCLVY
jgi:hypothetical protein